MPPKRKRTVSSVPTRASARQRNGKLPKPSDAPVEAIALPETFEPAARQLQVNLAAAEPAIPLNQPVEIQPGVTMTLSQIVDLAEEEEEEAGGRSIVIEDSDDEFESLQELMRKKDDIMKRFRPGAELPRREEKIESVGEREGNTPKRVKLEVFSPKARKSSTPLVVGMERKVSVEGERKVSIKRELRSVSRGASPAPFPQAALATAPAMPGERDVNIDPELADLLEVIPKNERVGGARKRKKLLKKSDYEKYFTGQPIEQDVEDSPEAQQELQDQIKRDEEDLAKAVERLNCKRVIKCVTETIRVDRNGDEVEDEAKLDPELLPVRSKVVTREKVRHRLPGMITTLLDHQILGVDWMVRQEKQKNRPHGGLLADAMGLGKTMQCIATMCANRPPRENRRKGEGWTTLIVCPVSLLEQWKEEIIDHSENGMFDVFIHHGKDKAKTVDQLTGYDVVLTSYGVVANSCPTLKPPVNMTDVEKAQWEHETWERDRGILHRVDWWRVILDEAHIIKNRDTRTSEACCRLQGQNLWALSGTPIHNSLLDLYAIFRFIDMPVLRKKNHYDDIMRKRSESMHAIRAALHVCMLRRQKEDRFLGKPIIVLPKKRVRIIRLAMTPMERRLYSMYEAQMRLDLNKILRQSTVGENFMQILVLLLRLRQLCSHVFPAHSVLRKLHRHSIEGVLDDDLYTEEGFAKERAKAEKESENKTIEAVMQLVNAESVPCDMNSKETADINEALKNYLEYLIEKNNKTPAHMNGELLEDSDQCPICLDTMENPVKTDCNHTFCDGCIRNHVIQCGNRGVDETCPKCARFIDLSRLKSAKDPVITLLKSQEAKEHDAEFQDLIDNRLFASSKMSKMLSLVKEWQETRPEDKIVIFSNFTKLLDIAEKLIEGEGYETTRFQGDMNIEERQESLRKFRLSPDCNVMLISLRAGGVGLNLTHANLVISLDLWWNAAVEHQAFDRVHRLGQTKEVEIVRFVMEHTVDERMFELQMRKLQTANHALGDMPLELMGKQSLSREELLGLFGRVVRPAFGQVAVEAD